jgi:hypothetical protein
VSDATTRDWDLQPGAFLTREERRRRFGGSTQGGIQPSALTPNVFLYTDPLTGLSHGYNFDGWSPDGTVFFYTGEGRYGDQTLTHGNGAILNHRTEGRTLRVFSAEGTVSGSQTKQQRYLGEFELDASRPVEWEVAPDTAGVLRSVVVFRLRPIGPVLRRPREASDNPIAAVTTREVLAPLEGPLDDVVEQVLLERSSAPRFFHMDEESLRISVRREAELVTSLTGFLFSLGHEVVRNRITPAGNAFPLYTDVYDVTANVLYEAKASAERPYVRLAVGQLLDYKRYMSNEIGLSGLFPSRPGGDLPELLEYVGVGLSHPIEGGFALTSGRPLA